MRGPAWLASYVAFAVALLWVSLAVINVYRRLESSNSPPWPSERFVPGRALPDIPDIVDGSPIASLPDALILFVSASVPQTYPFIMASSACAARHRLPLAIVSDEGSGRLPDEWLDELRQRAELTTHVVTSRATFARLQLQGQITVAVVRDGSLRDAAVGPLTLNDLESRFSVFLDSEDAFSRGAVR